jgi:RNA polymerase sigma-70 factor (ECF subfamily)
MTVPDHTLDAACRGDREAVALLYRTYVQQIYRYIIYRVDTNEDAEDLTAEVFVKMVEGLSGYKRTGAPFEAWLYRIAAARVVDYRRRKARRPVTELTEAYSDDQDTPEESLEQAQEVDLLRRAIQTLNDEQQAVLVLRFIERKSHHEVAAIVNKSVSAVKSIQHRALQQIASVLGSAKMRHYLRGASDE